MIYLDNAATTKMYDEVIDIEKDFEKNFLQIHPPYIVLVWMWKIK